MELLEQYFDTAFSAPEGIQKLRELILTLAMQGKLVPQNSNDTPASELLKDIGAEKERLVKQGKIKTPKLLQPVKEKEIPHALPEGWAWVRFGDVAQHNSGKTLDKGRNAGKPRNYITTSNLYWGRFELGSVRQMLIKDDELDKCTAKKNDLLICEGGEAGRAAVWPFDSDVCFQNHIHRARFYRDIDPRFAYRFFEKLNATGEINEHRKGVGISNMSGKALASILFPLAPFPEQRRIVAKIDELMARCDALEKLRTDREEKRLAAHDAALTQLLDSSGDGSPDDAWAFITQHFGELYAVKENVAELRKAILQLAVMGKLVPQNLSDSSASQIVRKVADEREELVKKGEAKPLKTKTFEPAPILFEVPKNWVWGRIQDVSLKVTDGEHATPRRSTSGYYLLSARNITNEGIKLDDVDFVEKDEFQRIRKRCNPEIGDVLISCSGSVGRVAVADSNEYVMVRSAALIKQSRKHLNGVFLSNALKAPFAQLQIIRKSRTTAQSNLFLGKILEIEIPIPPFEEQNRIVAKIDRLMALCDILDKQISAATKKQSALLYSLFESRISNSTTCYSITECVAQTKNVNYAS